MVAKRIEVKYVEDTVWITDFRECRCLTIGMDDGETTCWKHHRCELGDCTHQDNDDYYSEEEDEA